MTVNYVKFMSGTQALYNSLSTKDQDTLYFVYTSQSSETGKLYLGNKLISGSSLNPGGDISLGDVADVLLSNNIEDGDLLVYDEAEGKWVNQSVAEALQVPIMQGATSSSDGVEGLVPAPLTGDEGKFLRGDGTWVTVQEGLTAEERQSIQDLETSVATLIDEDENMSIRDIVAEEVAELLIPENASESLDTLQEIANWIQDHPDDASQMSSDISILQTKVQDLEDIVNGTQNTDGLEDRVEALESTMGTFVAVPGSYLTVGSAITYFNSSITEINDRLRWHELGQE